RCRDSASLSATRISGRRRSWSTAGGFDSAFEARLPVIDRKASPSFTALSCTYLTYSRRSSTVTGCDRSSRWPLEKPTRAARRALARQLGILAAARRREQAARPAHLPAAERPLLLLGLERLPGLGDPPERRAASRQVGGGRPQLPHRRLAPLPGLGAVVRVL